MCQQSKRPNAADKLLLESKAVRAVSLTRSVRQLDTSSHSVIFPFQAPMPYFTVIRIMYRSHILHAHFL